MLLDKSCKDFIKDTKWLHWPWSSGLYQSQVDFVLNENTIFDPEKSEQFYVQITISLIMTLAMIIFILTSY